MHSVNPHPRPGEDPCPFSSIQAGNKRSNNLLTFPICSLQVLTKSIEKVVTVKLDVDIVRMFGRYFSEVENGNS